MLSSLIEVNQLSFSYRKSHPILQAIDLHVDQGTIYGFLGPNGAGKTTVIRLLLGLLPDASQSVRLFGKNWPGNQLELLAKIGSLIEQPSLYEHLSGWNNLGIVRRMRAIPLNRVPHVLSLVGLTDAASYPVHTYSLGMKQRLGLAMALLGEPQLLILDEPVNGLDPAGMIEIRQVLHQLNQQIGVTIFLSSHLLAELEKLVTHVGILHQGKMRFEGSIYQLNERSIQQARIHLLTNDNRFAYDLLYDQWSVDQQGDHLQIPFQSHQQTAYLVHWLVQHQVDVYELSIKRPDLEQLFFHLTN